MRAIAILMPILWLGSLVSPAESTTNATPSTPIAGVQMINRQPSGGIARHYIRVDLVGSIAPSSVSTTNIQVQFEPSGTPVPDISNVATQAGNNTVVEITFSSPQPSLVPAGDSPIK